MAVAKTLLVMFVFALAVGAIAAVIQNLWSHPRPALHTGAHRPPGSSPRGHVPPTPAPVRGDGAAHQPPA